MVTQDYLFHLTLNMVDKDSFGEKMRGKILLVDDNDEFLDSTRDVLETEGYQVITAANGEDAVALAASQPFNIVLMDIKMPGLNGVDSFLKMKAQNPDVQVILLTAYFMEMITEIPRTPGRVGRRTHA
jgi:CheY-like chemotaxis protein